MTAADPGRHLPLRPADLHLLLALAEGDGHGYGLVQAIARDSGGLIRLDPGNLYRVIKRLLADGLIGEAPAPAADADRRRYYRLTPLGRTVLTLELRRLDALVRPPAVRALMQGLAT